VTINGNLAVTGDLVANRSQFTDLRSQTATISALHLTSDIRDLQSQTGFGNLLTVYNPTGNEVASIDASGAATFTKLIIASPEATSSSNIYNLTSNISTNASVGTATLPAGQTEIQIQNLAVTDKSLIYLTPTSATQNQVLYLKTKTANAGFTIAIDQPILTDITFQYWIIDTH
ncbi:MAG: hypothetical protein HY381_01055, partial [Candidatus Chisholmbacteria bacterium]|nr:hypothetical protein [Candidatus Chisholmbacteria bacterium]